MVRYRLMELGQLDTSLRVWTIGHSAHSSEQFMMLLRSAGITAIADVRTSPYSRFSPHFNRDELRDELRLHGISYVFLGKELGGRPANQRFYCEGVADYEKMAHTEDFKKGLERVIEGARKYKIAVMCSEQDPMDCHRCLLVGRALAERGVRVGHIQGNGAIAAQEQIENRLLELSGRSFDDLFAPREDRLATAYRDHSRKVAFARRQPGPQGPVAAE
jgi:uncharacterized protein (DUF488 family)